MKKTQAVPARKMVVKFAAIRSAACDEVVWVEENGLSVTRKGKP
jgi:hypothetical protein